MGISILEKTEKYVVVKIPRWIWEKTGLNGGTLTEKKAAKILKDGMAEYRAKKTKRLTSLRELRYGN